MANIIKTKSSDIPSRVPKRLAHGELAVNIPDGKLYVGNANGDSVLLNTGKIPPSPTSIADAYVLEIQTNGIPVIPSPYVIKEPSFIDYKEWISTHTGQFPLFVVIKGVTYIAFEYDETHIKAYHFNETTIQSIVSITFGNLSTQFNIRAVNATFVEKSLGTEAVAEERDRAVKAEQELSSRIDQNSKAISDGGALRPLYESLPGVKFNEETGFYELGNELLNVTPNQMAVIYNNPIVSGLTIAANIRALMQHCLNYVPVSNISISYSANTEIIFGQTFINPRVFNCDILRTIYGQIIISGSTVMAHNPLLTGGFTLTVRPANNISIDLSYCPKIEYDVWESIPEDKTGDKLVSVTADALPYSLLTGTATSEQYTASGHTKEEWMQIVTDSTAKGITFTKAL